MLLAILLLPHLLPVAHAQDPLLRPEDRIAVLQALSAGDMTVPDLSWQKDAVQADGVLRDHWRLPGIERLLHAPMEVPADAARWSNALTVAQGDPSSALLTAVEALGLTLPALAVEEVECAPAERRAWKRLDPRLQQEVCALVAVPTPTSGWLPAQDEETLRSLLSPDGEDAWDATEAMDRTRSLLASLDSLDLSQRIAIARAGLAALTAAEQAKDASWPTTLQTFTFPLATIQVGTPGPDHYTAPLTLDPGGDDLYVDPPASLALHLDLAGNDLWTGGEGSLGGAVGGVSLLIDAAGNDTYRGGRASLGAGVGGVGVLVDRGGDDSYRGVATTQGAGVAGVGLLMDSGGSDNYDGAVYAQGYAGVRGYGALWDGGGDDVYRAGGTYPDMPTRFPDHTLSLSQGFSIGLRPEAGGGLGLLVDEAGNDAYDADLFAQGCSYWFSRGYLVDRQGNDRYHTYQYGQGSGIHLSVGALFDLAGQDAYSGGNLIQGSSHDFAVGWLVDRTGDDVYAANSTAQGGSLTNSATFFVDAAGDDAYLYRLPFSRGAGRFDRNMGSVGVFVDVAGTDQYDGRSGNDGVVRPWAYGVVVDGSALLPPPDPLVEPPPMRPVTARPAPPPSNRATPTAQDLADLAAADAVSCQDPPACEARRLALIAEGPATFARLLPALPRDVLSEGYTLDALLRGMRSPQNDPLLRASLLQHLGQGPTHPGTRWVVRWLGDLGVDPNGTAVSLSPLAADPDPRVRLAVATAVLAWKTTPPLLAALAADSDAQVRAVTALALGAGGAPVEQIAPLLRDDSVLVRFNAADVLLARPVEQVRPALLSLWSAGDWPSPAVRRLVLELLIRVGGKDSGRIVAAVAAGDADPWAQRKAAAALAGQVPAPWRLP